MKQGIPILSHPPYSPGLEPADFLYPKLKIALIGSTFVAVSMIHQTVTRTERNMGKAFSQAFDSLCVTDVNLMPKWVEAILCDGIKKYSLSFPYCSYGLGDGI